MKYPKPPKGWYSADCEFCIPGKKKAIAYCTTACMEMIMEYARDGLTIQETRDIILYDVEAQKVLDEYIKRGFGDKNLTNWK